MITHGKAREFMNETRADLIKKGYTDKQIFEINELVTRICFLFNQFDIYPDDELAIEALRIVLKFMEISSRRH